MANLFAICLIISICVLIFMISRNYNNIDLEYWSMVIIIPIVLLGYTLKAVAADVDDAKMAFCFLYLDSTVLLVLMLFAMIKSLGISLGRGIKTFTYLMAVLHMVMIWMCIKNNLYYATFEVIKKPLGTVTKMTDGPLKIIHYIYLAIIFFAIVGILIWCFVKKKDVSKKSMLTYGLLSASGVVIYIIEMTAGFDFSLLPFLYVAGDIMIALNYEQAHSHDLGCVIVEYRTSESNRGYVAFDLKRNLLCYNEKAIDFIPEIKGKRIDAPFGNNEEKLRNIFYKLIDDFDENVRETADYTQNGTTFRCSISKFNMHAGGRDRGYLCEIQDVTAEQGYLNLIKEYSQSMEKDVQDKTEHIRFIQQKVVLGMATIIENRDMNTGGHVKRTSDIIKILVDEMMRQNIGGLDEKYADEIIRSAPMHDLGKISIDNVILNKPAKLTDEEYAIMKTHSAKSGEIVKAILAGVEEEHFIQTAYCLARFHHERWDGKGYPERLIREEIPLEARIMAVADVYDALVSERCYKEPMSFDMAAKIMLEGMGTQFDPMMKPIFENCREKLEDYYRNND